MKGYLPAGHWLLDTITESKHQQPLDRMIALRNFAAHESPASRRKALEAIGQKRVGTAGSWIKRQGRFAAMTHALRQLATDIEAKAPH